MTVLVIAFVALVFTLVILFKINNTEEMQITILYAIYDYRQDCIENRWIFLVDFEDMETFEETLFRLWDWGYERILPPEKYEIIKPYIGGGNHAA